MGKRKKTRSDSSSSSQSSSSDDDRRARRKKERLSKKKSKRREFSEERRLRKEEKKMRKQEQLAASVALMGYTDADNPFGDVNLAQKFVWHKKKKRDRKKGISEEEQKKMEELNRDLTRAELEKLQHRRKEREIEMQLREEEKLRMQREADQAALGDWESREDDFHLAQAHQRAKIRIKEGRAKPIDVLAINMQLAENPDMLDVGFEVDTDEPYLLFDELELDEVQELHKDIQMYLSLEKCEKTRQFWEALLIVADDVKFRMISKPASSTDRPSDAVHADIDNMLCDKKYEQLRILEGQIKEKLRSGGPVDVEYWERLLKGLTVWKAKARLRAMHQDMLRTRLEQLRQKSEQEAAAHSAPVLATDETQVEKEKEKKLISLKDAMRKGKDEDEELKVTDDTLYQTELNRGMDEDEELFMDEMSLMNENYSWTDKYRPRKPRYFNRVHTGFEWNKYNQTHYDPDNPPPKVVQGYKFNIFYPDLIDKAKAPTYKIIKDTQAVNEETVIIKFTAGPPYEDVAFKIVNKEWEMSHRRGFRSVFDRGVLQLHFNFKRYWYRR